MGEKKRRLAAGLPGAAHDDGKRIAEAFEALRRGDRRAAASAFEALLSALPRDAEALHAAGVLGVQLGDAARAEALLSRAVAIDPRHPAYRCHLAIACRRLGKHDRAIAELEIALTLDPALAEAHSNLGNVLRERGDHAAAVKSFQRALAIRRDYPDALNGLGEAEFALGRLGEAVSNFERALALDPQFHEAAYNLSRARTERAVSIETGSDAEVPSPAAIENRELALESILAALTLDDGPPAYWTQFESCISPFDLRPPVDPRVRDLLLRALDHPAVDPVRLVRPIVSLATTGPDAMEIRRALPASGTVDPHAWSALCSLVRGVLGDPLLQRLLADVVVPSRFIERLLGFSRRGLLGESTGRLLRESSLPLAGVAAIAHQGFNTEYAGEESAEEGAEIASLRAAIEDARASGTPVPLHAYALYACYRPLDTLGAAEAIAGELLPTELRSLALRQIVEPQEERRLRATIATSTGIVGRVSAAVQRQYEANPYPRWQRIGRSIAPTTVAAFLRARFPGADRGAIADGPARILVAGCGTGRHPIGTALRFPDSTIVAVDLSLTSLAYAARKTRELGIGNVDFRQADILALGPIAERFDLIECVGVLHHLEDPESGWRILSSLLRPGGVMRIGLYSEAARRHVVRARELVAARGFAPTTEGMRACRAAILAGSDDPLLARVARGEDFYSLSGCRDLIFNVCEHRYTLPAIAALLFRLDLDFAGFDLPDAGVAASYRAQFPDDRALADLARWHEFETARPDTFANMYQFWVRKPE